MDTNHPNLLRVFQQAFCVQDVASPLISFDDTTLAEEVKSVMEAQRFAIAGVRRRGVVAAFVELGDLKGGCCGDAARHIKGVCVVADTLPLPELIGRLETSPRLFVTYLGQIGGTVTRQDILRPPARMWLFGMVTLIEMRFSLMIESQCPNDSWRAHLSPGRVEKAQALLTERARRNQHVKLSDCLQFSDKSQIIARHDPLRRLTRFDSRRQVEEMGKRLEKLRNNLAHSQDIVAEDWETIILLSANLQSVLNGPPGMVASDGV